MYNGYIKTERGDTIMYNFISENGYKESMENVVLPYIEPRRKDGMFRSFDGNELHFAFISADEPKANIALLHGFTESIEKFMELSYYFVQEGYNVYILEQRGHGKSYRAVADYSLTHVDRFTDYVEDFSRFVDEIIGDKLPLYIYAHSMGGGVAALYLEKYPTRVAKAVLSSPMISPTSGGVPHFLSRFICKMMMIFGKKEERLFMFGPYKGHEDFETSSASSKARFDYYDDIKFNNEIYQNSSPTYTWSYEGLGVTKKILKKGEVEKIETPVLMFQAKQDTMVLLPAQDKFVSRLRNGQKVELDTRHEIYRAPDGVLREALDRMFEFYAN